MNLHYFLKISINFLTLALFSFFSLSSPLQFFSAGVFIVIFSFWHAFLVICSHGNFCLMTKTLNLVMYLMLNFYFHSSDAIFPFINLIIICVGFVIFSQIIPTSSLCLNQDYFFHILEIVI